MNRCLVAVFFIALVASGVQSLAHHSFAATYLKDESVTIEGQLIQFVFRNPHSFVHIAVKERDGSEVRYAVEWGGAGQLGVQGVTRETLKPGDRIVITGCPGRNAADHRIRMISMRRPKDGFTWGQRPGEVVD